MGRTCSGPYAHGPSFWSTWLSQRQGGQLCTHLSIIQCTGSQLQKTWITANSDTLVTFGSRLYYCRLLCVVYYYGGPVYRWHCSELSRLEQAVLLQQRLWKRSTRHHGSCVTGSGKERDVATHGRALGVQKGIVGIRWDCLEEEFNGQQSWCCSCDVDAV